MPVKAGMELLTENAGPKKTIPMVCKRMKGSLWELSFFVAGKRKEGQRNDGFRSGSGNQKSLLCSERKRVISVR